MKSVSPSLYTRKYYLSYCSGYNEYKKTFGKLLETRLKNLVKKIRIKKDFQVLDLGCGRGEFSLWAARQGAVVKGIDYSRSAIMLAKEALSKSEKSVRSKVSFYQMNAKKLKFKSNNFNLVVSFEVFEHLYPVEQKIILKEMLRVLEPGGLVVIHTEPNKIFNEFTYRFWCYPISSLLIFLNRLITHKQYPNLPRWDTNKIRNSRTLHVNEPTFYKLKELLDSTGQDYSIYSPNVIWTKPRLSWKDTIYNLFVFALPFSYFWPFNILWGQDFLITIKKK